MTVTHAAEQVGVTQPAWSQWEKAGDKRKNPTPSNVAAILHLLAIEDAEAIVLAADADEWRELNACRAELEAGAAA